MFTLSAVLKDFIWPNKSYKRVQHSYKHPYEALKKGWFPPDFPVAAIFLDSSWTPDRSEMPPQFRDNKQSGLRSVEPQHWLYMDPKKFYYESTFLNAVMADDFKERDVVLISR